MLIKANTDDSYDDDPNYPNDNNNCVFLSCHVRVSEWINTL